MKKAIALVRLVIGLPPSLIYLRTRCPRVAQVWGQSPDTKASSSTSGSGVTTGKREGVVGSEAGCNFGILMSHAKPSDFRAAIPSQFTSISYQVRPCLAACGAA